MIVNKIWLSIVYFVRSSVSVWHIIVILCRKCSAQRQPEAWTSISSHLHLASTSTSTSTFLSPSVCLPTTLLLSLLLSPFLFLFSFFSILSRCILFPPLQLDVFPAAALCVWCPLIRVFQPAQTPDSSVLPYSSRLSTTSLDFP